MPNKLVPCKHLDYSEEYAIGGQCILKTCAPHYPDVKFWYRENLSYKGAPQNVQFCGAGRGRINGIFDCYGSPGPMSCYEPEAKGEKQ